LWLNNIKRDLMEIAMIIWSGAYRPGESAVVGFCMTMISFGSPY